MTTQTMTVLPMERKISTQHPAARFWDKTARKYAKDKISDQAGYERSLARTQQFLTKDMHVLEVGCGTGTTALHHAPYVKQITGTDISPEMVTIATEKLADSGMLNADFVVSTADSLPFAAESFDLVMAHNLLHLVDDVDASLRMVAHMLPKGGIFISKTPCLGEMNALMRKVVIPVMMLYYRLPALHRFTERRLVTRIIRAGFQIEHVEYHASKGRDTRPFIIARKR